MNKEKEILKHLSKIQTSLQIETLGKLLGYFLTCWFVVWIASAFLIYIFQIPYNYWKYGSFLLLILGVVHFVKKKNKIVTILINPSKKKNLLYNFLIEHLPQKENYLIYEEFKNKIKTGNPFLQAAFKQLLFMQDITEYTKILNVRKTGQQLVKFFSQAIISFLLLLISVNVSPKINNFWLHPFVNYIEPLPFQFTNLIEKKKVFEGDSVVFKVEIDGEDAENVWVEVEELSTNTTVRISLKKWNKNKSIYFSKKIPISENIKYRYLCKLERYLNIKEFSSEEYLLEHINLPEISRLEFKVIPPPYTKLKTQHYLEDHTNINCYAGSFLEILGRVDGKVDEILVSLKDSEKKQMDISEEFNFRYMINNSGELSFNYIAFDSINIEYPVKYYVNILKDESPFIELLAPVGEIELGNDLTINIKLKVIDDFGFSKMEMHKKRYASNVDTIETVTDVSSWLSGKQVNLINENLNFSEDYLLPEEKMDVFFKIYDNDRVNGYKNVKSDFFTIIIPTFKQISLNISKEINESINKTNDIFNKGQKIKAELKKMQRKALQSKEVNWEQKQKITEQIDQAKQIEETLQNIQKEIEKNISKMNKNDMISKETLQKYFDLQEMFQKLMDSEFLEKMKKMEEALKNKSNEELNKLMKQSDFSINEFEEQIERVYELFKKVEIERKLDELVQLNKKINNAQEDNANKFTEKNEFNNVGNRQSQIVKDEQFFQNSLDELRKELGEKEHSLEKKLSDVNEFQEMNEILDKIERMQSSAEQNDISEYQKTHLQTMPALQNRLKKMENMKKGFVDQEKNEMKGKINYIIEEMLSLSKKQENLNVNLKNTRRFSSNIEQLALEQLSLNNFMLYEINKIIELSQESFFLPMMLNQPLSKAQNNMKKVIASLEERRTYQLAKQSDSILKNLNKAIFLLLQTQNSIDQSQSGTGIEKFMQQMEQMAKMQSGVNQQSMQLFQNGKQGQMPGQGDPQSLAKLAAQQQAIQRSMEKLGESMKEGGGRGKSQVEKMAEEMKEIVKKLQRKRIDRKTIDRQEKILSRMLDASRSLHKKDQSEKRKAEIAGDYVLKVPNEIGNIIFLKNKIHEEYQKALEQDLSPEIKKMLKEYYDELLENAIYQ